MGDISNMKWVVVHVKETGGDARVGLYVDGHLIAVDIDETQDVMETALEQGWVGQYEKHALTGLEARHHCNLYQQFPRLLSAITLDTGAKGEVCKFPGEVD